MQTVELEEMSLNAWPALQTITYKGCLFRLSEGYTNRANSANPLYSVIRDGEDLIDYGESFYGRQEQKSVFKILNRGDFYLSLDGLLEQRGYGQVTPTRVMVKSLDVFHPPSEDLEMGDAFSGPWFSAFAGMNGLTGSRADTAWRMLSAMKFDRTVASISADGKIIACGYGALEMGRMGLFDIVVSQDYRGKGYGRALVSALLGEGARRGAKSAYLQVVEENVRARNLYQSLGFGDVYGYWYRVKG